VTESNSGNQEPSQIRKRVDEDWKKQVERDKAREAAKEPRQQPPPGGPPGTDFVSFISGLAMQAMMSLGEVAHPNTGRVHENLGEAKYLIDMLTMLQEKTKGNLTEDEAAALEEALYSLKMTYVRKTGGRQKG